MQNWLHIKHCKLVDPIKTHILDENQQFLRTLGHLS